MGKRIAKGSKRHEEAILAVEQSKVLQYEQSERERRDENRVRGPRGYGSQLRGWQGGQ